MFISIVVKTRVTRRCYLSLPFSLSLLFIFYYYPFLFSYGNIFIVIFYNDLCVNASEKKRKEYTEVWLVWLLCNNVRVGSSSLFCLLKLFWTTNVMEPQRSSKLQPDMGVCVCGNGMFRWVRRVERKTGTPNEIFRAVREINWKGNHNSNSW